MNPTWDDLDVDPAALRRDVEAMVDAVRHALLTSLPSGSVRGLYFKGSAAKPWDGPVDYVADLSDVDIHLWLEHSAIEKALAELRDLAGSLRRHELVESRFRELRPTPSHTPRVQVVVLNELITQEHYLPSPAATVHTMHGEPYSGAGDIDVSAARRADAHNLRDAADPAVIAKAVADLVEKPGHHLFGQLRTLSWRVSPTPQRVLTLRGAGYAEAWGANRTACLRGLAVAGEAALAADLTAYYLSAWRAQRSGWSDSAAGRDAFAAAIRTLERGRQIAEEAFPAGAAPGHTSNR